MNSNGTVKERGSRGSYFKSTVTNKTQAYNFNAASREMNINGTYYGYKNYGNSLRCVVR